MIVTEYMENGALDRYLRVSQRAFEHDSWANRPAYFWAMVLVK